MNRAPVVDAARNRCARGGARRRTDRLAGVGRSDRLRGRCLREFGGGPLLTDGALRAALSPSIDAPGPIIVYCGGGISAARPALGLAVAGRTDVAVYDGSLEEWTKDPGRPVAVSS